MTMKTKQPTTTATATLNRLDEIKKAIRTLDTPTQAPTPAEAKQSTTDRLNELMDKRNSLLLALEQFPTLDTLQDGKTEIVNELCDTISQISVYKTLLKLADSPKDITENGSKKCEEMYFSFTFDMITYRTNDTTATYSDAMDLYNIAFMQVWEYLNSSAPLTLADTVETKVLKNGDEKNYTIFQTACKSIREYIHSWSKSDQYKKLHYIIGYTENGSQVTSSKRPPDTLTDIDEDTRKAFFIKYGLTAHEQDIISLLIKGENADSIALLLNTPKVTIYKQMAKAKAKFATASAYAELKTAQNAEKLAKAKAEKNPTDSIYQRAYTTAQHRTAKALTEWKKAFTKENRTK